LQVADSRKLFSTEIDTAVSERSRVDDEVTCDVCSVTHFSNVESRLKVGDDIVAVVDEVVCTGTRAGGRHTQTIIPG